MNHTLTPSFDARHLGYFTHGVLATRKGYQMVRLGPSGRGWLT